MKPDQLPTPEHKYKFGDKVKFLGGIEGLNQLEDYIFVDYKDDGVLLRSTLVQSPGEEDSTVYDEPNMKTQIFEDRLVPLVEFKKYN